MARPSSAPAPQQPSEGARVLVVEDDVALAEVVALALAEGGYQAVTEGDGRSGLRRALTEPFELVILDILLPGLDGLVVCRELRRHSLVPILMLTAKAETADVVAGLNCGADDYLTKPFEVDELLARVRAVLRRSDVARGPAVRLGDLEIDLEAMVVRRLGREVPLTATEFRLLLAFAESPHKVLTREALLQEIWGYDYLGDSGIVNMAVKRLRDKVEEDPSQPRLIRTVRGVGYRLDPP
ncbi:MAG: response regulator transcription factor [Actinomycetota bacterium]|nr:response regulator transcription factor [Actinomycetota bacterium]